MNRQIEMGADEVRRYTLTSKGLSAVRAHALFEKELAEAMNGNVAPQDVRDLLWGWFHAGYKARDGEEPVDVGEIG